MKKSLMLVAIAVLMTSVAAADVSPKAANILSPDSGQIRANGTLGSVTISAQQVGSLQVALDASATTQGGDGVPVVVTFGGVTYTLNNQVWVYGQIYDSPWDGGCSTWDTPGPDWCAYGEEFFINSPTPLGSFATSFTTTVPGPANYQTFVVARAGLTWADPAYDWFNTSQSAAYSVVETIYVDSTQPPTPTPDPNAGGQPIPTVNRWGMLAMVGRLIGVAVLVIIRRK